MKKLLLPLLIIALASGCSTRSNVGRYTTDAAVTAGAAYAGYKLSNNNPAIGLAAGLGALGIKRIMENKADEEQRKELEAAFNRGRGQAAAEGYAAIQNTQRDGFSESLYSESRESAPDTLTVPIVAPERVINGVRVRETQEFITLTK
jgi:hypothetical protein